MNKLNTVKLQKDIHILQKSSNINLFIYTNYTNKADIDVAIHNYNVNTFSLLEFGKNTQNIQDSQINISINFEVFQGSILCLVCDVKVVNCTLIFIAIGQQLSGLILEAKSLIQIESTFVQYRMSSQSSSGIVSLVQQDIVFNITNCQLAGSNIIQSPYNGYIAASIQVSLTLDINKFVVCATNISQLGQYSATIIYTLTEIQHKCDICGTNYVVYGLCAQQLLLGTYDNGALLCSFPFEYADNQCVCTYGYILNLTSCVNVIEAINSINSLGLDLTSIQQMQLDINSLSYLLQQLDINTQINISQLANNITSYYSILQQQIINNFSNMSYYLQSNVSLLDNQLIDNITSLNNIIFVNSTTLENYIYDNCTTINQRILNNITTLNSYLAATNTKIQTVDDIISNFSKYIECVSKFGFKFENGECQQDACSIIGQELMNGICQCIYFNAIIISDVCVCPMYSTLIEGICTCDISGQIVEAGTCVCPTYQQEINGQCVLL
ncbi:Hypothetical_protein [Hexamita inflata]|uniref:Hypothetical_protein n=1 Tax=Hexamita inflata TaxID=28002 RepID=A0AA86N476_9EUKA|nr:Hypothetical protein HINF_LOCUS144 [Hexamita inflata]CAI9912500.1 Hypothetical protein HINF_LOCUS145 [Hexamita inflata]